MADVAVSTQLQQWSFEKPPTVRPERSDSTPSSPDLSLHDPETLRIDTAAVHVPQDMASNEAPSFQELYLSSEEDLSPMDANSSEDDSDSDSDVSIYEAEKSYLKARTMSISKWDKGKSCDLAVRVSYVSAGRPKMIHLASSPVQDSNSSREIPQRSTSLTVLPIAAISKLRQQDQQARRSLMVNPTVNRSPSPAMSEGARRPSTGSALMHSDKSAVRVSNSGSGSSLQSGGSTPRSSSPSLSEKSISSTGPVSAAAIQPRSSLYVVSSARSNDPLAPLAPPTPQSPGPHAFLSSDPYENSTTNAASPIIKSAPHRRLRSISQKLSLAKIAITPSTKKWDSRISGRTGNMPPTPSTPHTPLTPQTAPLPTWTPMNKLRRNSRRLSRPGTARGPSPDIPPVPSVASSSPNKRVLARGANEREPTLELPPFPDEEAPIKSRLLRKRKSLMDLL